MISKLEGHNTRLVHKSGAGSVLIGPRLRGTASWQGTGFHCVFHSSTSRRRHPNSGSAASLPGRVAVWRAWSYTRQSATFFNDVTPTKKQGRIAGRNAAPTAKTPPPPHAQVYSAAVNAYCSLLSSPHPGHLIHSVSSTWKIWFPCSTV